MSDQKAAITVYSKAACPYCEHAKNLLSSLNLPYEEVRIDLNPDRLDEMLEASAGGKSFPQIVVKDFPVGGYTDLRDYVESGKLDALLNSDE
jgi:glutaredoxin 3